MRVWKKSVVAVTAIACLALAEGSARAQATPYAPQPTAQGNEGQACYPNETCNGGLTCASHYCVKLPPASANAPNGEYVAPIQQQTQQTYVPQSVAMSGPREIKGWSEGDPIPQGYHPTTHVRTGLIVAGLVTFGTMYLFSVLGAAATMDVCNGFKSVGSTTTCNDGSMLFIPVVGPFIQATRTGPNQSFGAAMLVVDGVVQAAGVAMFIMGIAWQKTSLVRNDLGSNTAPKLKVMPYFAGTTGGLVGTF